MRLVLVHLCRFVHNSDSEKGLILVVLIILVAVTDSVHCERGCDGQESHHCVECCGVVDSVQDGRDGNSHTQPSFKSVEL